MNTAHEAMLASHVERVQPNETWVRHFRQNRDREWNIPWHWLEKLPRSASQRIGASIAEFQRGESSDGRHYLANSELFSGRTGDPAFHAASVLFVREENAHAELLLRFMHLAGIPVREHSVADGVFRRLRGFGDLGWSSRVLMIAELIAQEYYPCLRAATDHPVLVRICDKICFDEQAHIRFQIERIVRLEAALGPVAIAMRDRLQEVLMHGAAIVVQTGHRSVIASQMTGAEFRARVAARNRHAITAMRSLRGGSSFGIARAAAAV